MNLGRCFLLDGRVLGRGGGGGGRCGCFARVERKEMGLL